MNCSQSQRGFGYFCPVCHFHTLLTDKTAVIVTHEHCFCDGQQQPAHLHRLEWHRVCFLEVGGVYPVPLQEQGAEAKT